MSKENENSMNDNATDLFEVVDGVLTETTEEEKPNVKKSTAKKSTVKKTKKTTKSKKTEPVEKEKPEKLFRKNKFVSSGCTILDLACTDTTDGFCETGHTVNIVGDRNSGKTALSLAAGAETEYKMPGFFKHRFYDFEHAYSFDTEHMFGKQYADVLQILNPEHTLEWSIDALAKKIIDDVKKGPEFIILDSVDGMLSTDQIEDIATGKVLGDESYGGPRAKAFHRFFKSVCPAIALSGSFLIALSQAKDNMGFGAKFTPKYRSGGASFGFYAFIELWLAPGASINVGGLKVGAWTRAKVERSKYNGKKREVSFPILPAYGIDDTRANIGWLKQEGILKEAVPITIAKAKELKEQGKDVEPVKVGSLDLTTIGMDYVGTEPELYVEENGLVETLVKIVKHHWDVKEQDRIDKTFGGRKRRYE